MKVKAYTLLETLLTLVISSLVIVFIYTIYLYLDKQLLEFKEASEQILSFLVFDNAMSRDIYLAENVSGSQEKIILEFYDNNQVTYIIKNDSVFRTSSDNEYYTGVLANNMKFSQKAVGSYTISTATFNVVMENSIFTKVYHHRKKELRLAKTRSNEN